MAVMTKSMKTFPNFEFDWKRHRVILIVFAYVAGASAWIFFSDRMLSQFSDVAEVTVLATYKGLLFIGLTAPLLFFALRGVAGAGDPSPTVQGPKAWASLIIVLAVMVVVTFIAHVVYRAETLAARGRIAGRLETIAFLEATAASSWLATRRDGALFFATDLATREMIAHRRESADLADRRRLERHLTRLREHYGFAAVALLDARGAVLGGDAAARWDDPTFTAALERARRGEIVWLDPHPRPDGDLHMTQLVPVAEPGPDQDRISAVVVSDLRLKDQFLPYLASAGRQQRIGASVLVQTPAAEVLLVFDHTGPPAPLDRLRAPSDFGLRIEPGEEPQATPTFRDRPALVATAPISGTGLTLIVAADEDEALGGLRRLATMTGASLAVAFAACIALTIFLWRRQRVRAALVELAQRRRVQSAEDLYRTTFEKVGVGIVHVTFDGRWLRTNPAFIALSGYSADHLATASIADFFAPDERAGVATSLRRMRDGEVETLSSERKIQRADGRLAHVALTASAVGEADARYVVAVVEDITPRLDAERANAYLAAVVTFAPVAIVTASLDGKVETWNPGAAELFGCPPEAAIGRPVATFSFPDQSDDGDYYLARVRIGEAIRGETVRRRADGSAIDVAFSAAPIRDAEGRITATVTIMSDISERRRNERRLRERDEELRQTLDGAGLGVWWVDVAGGLVYCDPRSRQLFATDEVAPIAEVAGRFLADGDASFERIIAEVEAGSGGGTRVLRVKSTGGKPGWVALTARLRTTEDRMTEIWGTAQDVTERHIAEDAIRQLEASRRLEALGRMTGGIAHDFNNLLTVISGNLQLLEMRPHGETEARYIEEALRATENGANLNRRLTGFASRRRLTSAAADLNASVDGLIALLLRSIGPDITVTSDLTAGLWPVRVDASEIENAILNLVFNARDAMPGGGHIRIATRNVVLAAADLPPAADLRPGDWVRLSVADDGIGMTPDVRARAFEPFFTTKTSGGGTGLGLATLHGFVRQSGGFVTLGSEPGVGTTVELNFPRALSHGAADAQGDCGLVRGDGEMVLLVEDDPDVAEVTRQRLIELGYRVVACRDARAAISLVEAGTWFDVVLTDVMMPGGMTGLELARRLRDRDPACRILLASGYIQESAFGGTDTAEEFPLLAKPYTLPALARALAALLRPSAGGADGR
ncbi:PAS domain S-box protein [Siculibacillus lacustris]|nr:PAS domain S-box protein [Siculibacillus lacustris]